MRFLLKNSNGEHSISYTMLVSTFLVLTLWLLLSITSSIFGIEIREFPFEGATLWFGSVSALYFGRRYTERTTKSVLDETTKKEEKEKEPKSMNGSNGSGH